jgi:hypothetical protein
MVKSRGEFGAVDEPAAALVSLSALMAFAEEDKCWGEKDQEAREQCLQGLALLAQLTRLMVLAKTSPKEPITTDQLGEILGLDADEDLLSWIAVAIGAHPAWPGSMGIH